MRQIFVYRYHGYPQENQPDYPEGFPMRMLVYNYYRKLSDWHPRQVDELELDEVEWLPILEAANCEASEIIQKEIQAQSK